MKRVQSKARRGSYNSIERQTSPLDLANGCSMPSDMHGAAERLTELGAVTLEDRRIVYEEELFGGFAAGVLRV